MIPPALRSAATSLRDRAAFLQSEMMRPANDPKERDPAHVRMLNDVLRDLEKSFISPQSAPGVYRWEDVYSCDGVLLSSVGRVVCLGLTLMCNASKYVIFLHTESPQRVRQTQLTFWNLEGSKVKVGRCKGLMQPRLDGVTIWSRSSSQVSRHLVDGTSSLWPKRMSWKQSSECVGCFI